MTCSFNVFYQETMSINEIDVELHKSAVVGCDEIDEGIFSNDIVFYMKLIIRISLYMKLVKNDFH